MTIWLKYPAKGVEGKGGGRQSRDWEEDLEDTVELVGKKY